MFADREIQRKGCRAGRRKKKKRRTERERVAEEKKANDALLWCGVLSR